MSETTKEKHTVHCRAGGKVVINGDRVEIHLPGPIVVSRRQWSKFLSPHEEAKRTIDLDRTYTAMTMLEEAFGAVPMKVHSVDD